MLTEILTETTPNDIDQMVASRAERGLDLYLTRRALITHLHRPLRWRG